ncbi:hypothetical protein C2845_PM14G17660 [Panicum miliaceum]|uniref:Uncharacterized protein n=1 Tax=Panicum miliaceum TaxID=4540 RepID=A0A3L6PLK0_PANMI|nr:hypothetical protein C2845_PM14G17660 [Panicum miliaceum]
MDRPFSVMASCCEPSALVSPLPVLHTARIDHLQPRRLLVSLPARRLASLAGAQVAGSSARFAGGELAALPPSPELELQAAELDSREERSLPRLPRRRLELHAAELDSLEESLIRRQSSSIRGRELDLPTAKLDSREQQLDLPATATATVSPLAPFSSSIVTASHGSSSLASSAAAIVTVVRISSRPRAGAGAKEKRYQKAKLSRWSGTELEPEQ